MKGANSEAEEDDRKKGPSDETGLLSGSTGVYRKHGWFETTFPPLVPLSSIREVRETERGKRKKERLYPRNKLPAVHTGVATTPSGTHRPPSPLSPSIENMRGGQEGTIRRPRETVFNGERTTKLLDYPAFYFHEFRRTSARNHNQPSPIPPVFLRKPKMHQFCPEIKPQKRRGEKPIKALSSIHRIHVIRKVVGGLRQQLSLKPTNVPSRVGIVCPKEEPARGMPFSKDLHDELGIDRGRRSIKRRHFGAQCGVFREGANGWRNETERREEKEWKRNKSSGRNKASYRAKTLFCRQPLRLDPRTAPSFLPREGCNVPLSNSKTPLNEVNCSESNWDLSEQITERERPAREAPLAGQMAFVSKSHVVSESEARPLSRSIIHGRSAFSCPPSPPIAIVFSGTTNLLLINVVFMVPRMAASEPLSFSGANESAGCTFSHATSGHETQKVAEKSRWLSPTLFAILSHAVTPEGELAVARENKKKESSGTATTTSVPLVVSRGSFSTDAAETRKLALQTSVI
ncbi:hypothetical protein DBV15_08729 [Temnothorax longispinosus]|uniref:Uncharacterized protein n=1 Tax=Temnothorax longispinosus TaxID=300112 RepID=A0A4V3SB79_9HYME|nr:hypothetical protein DBV15_08729 [Temnothorax longispinosus]